MGELSGDATMVHGPTLMKSAKLAQWANRHFRLKCYACKKKGVVSEMIAAQDFGAGFSQWKGSAKDRAAGTTQKIKSLAFQRWCCVECAGTDEFVNVSPTGITNASPPPQRKKASPPPQRKKQTAKLSSANA